jgi:hypothetical protein
VLQAKSRLRHREIPKEVSVLRDDKTQFILKAARQALRPVSANVAANFALAAPVVYRGTLRGVLLVAKLNSIIRISPVRWWVQSVLIMLRKELGHRECMQRTDSR